MVIKIYEDAKKDADAITKFIDENLDASDLYFIGEVFQLELGLGISNYVEDIIIMDCWNIFTNTAIPQKP